MIKVIFKAPGKRSEVREIEDSYDAIEALLGGKSELAPVSIGSECYSLVVASEQNITSSSSARKVINGPVVAKPYTQQEPELKYEIESACAILDWHSIGLLEGMQS